MLLLEFLFEKIHFYIIFTTKSFLCDNIIFYEFYEDLQELL
jgi:hypothetical protein